ncbi:hypothetical protein PRIPAC_78327, partial [Pristionchus pacificus]|uniref:Uncharacterized protein n=1 Tax=Pristionchus pacificus TaxID=54126 RepID=A0A2A6C1U3_PRIPA
QEYGLGRFGFRKSKRNGKGKSSQFVDSDSGSGSEDESAAEGDEEERRKNEMESFPLIVIVLYLVKETERVRSKNRSLPTMGEIHKKMKDIASPGEHNYTNDEVNQLAESLRGEMAREMEGTSEQARVLHGRPPTTTTIEKE